MFMKGCKMPSSVYPNWHIISSKIQLRGLQFSDLNSSRYTSALHGQIEESTKSCVVGLSAGLLAAAAVACSPEITALIPLAVEVVLIAFRVGRLARTAARHIEVTRTEDSAASWSFVIPGMTQPEAQAALSAYNQSKVHSTTHTLIRHRLINLS